MPRVPHWWSRGGLTQRQIASCRGKQWESSLADPLPLCLNGSKMKCDMGQHRGWGAGAGGGDPCTWCWGRDLTGSFTAPLPKCAFPYCQSGTACKWNGKTYVFAWRCVCVFRFLKSIELGMEPEASCFCSQ